MTNYNQLDAFGGCTSLACIQWNKQITRTTNTVLQSCPTASPTVVPTAAPTSKVCTATELSSAGACCYPDVIINSGVTTISANAFLYCNVLRSVTIPTSVTSIGASAFSGCQSLSMITIPTSVTTIGASAFNSTGLTTVTIPTSVTVLG